ncbi:MAG: hypothetical protein OK436_06050 [Thaumarchaeota archaeon]|nr:hypothetical protein [Nitrososphaerota archaeon]
MKESSTDRRWKRREAALLRTIGEHESVARFMRKYGNQRSRVAYLDALAGYLERLVDQGVRMDPDALIADNLTCVFGSGPLDVATKRKHTDLLDHYVNGFLVKQGLRETTRKTRAAAIIQFYKRNDAPLFGDFDVSTEKIRAPPRPLAARDIRARGERLPRLSRTGRGTSGSPGGASRPAGRTRTELPRRGTRARCCPPTPRLW